MACRSGRANRDSSNKREAMSNPRLFFRPNRTPRRFLGLLAILLIAGGSALPSVAPVSARSAAHRPADAPMMADPRAVGNPGAESRPSQSPDPSTAQSGEPSVSSTAAPTAEAAPPRRQPSPLPRRRPSPPRPLPPTRRRHPSGPLGYIVTFAPGTSASTQASILAAAGADVTDSIAALRMAFIDVPTGSSVVVDLRADGNVSSVEARPRPDRRGRTRATPGTPTSGRCRRSAGTRSSARSRRRGSAVVAAPRHRCRWLACRPRRPARRRDLDPRRLRRHDRPERPRHRHGRASSRPLTDNGQGIAGIGYAGVKVMPVTVLDAERPRPATATSSRASSGPSTTAPTSST